MNSVLLCFFVSFAHFPGKQDVKLQKKSDQSLPRIDMVSKEKFPICRGRPIVIPVNAGIQVRSRCVTTIEFFRHRARNVGALNLLTLRQ